MICVGDYAQGAPVNCADAAARTIEELIAENKDNEYSEDEDTWNELSFAKHNPLYHLAERGREYYPKYSSLDAELTHRLDEADLALFRRLYALMRHSYPSPRPGILRNLDTKQFVRDQVVAQDECEYSLGDLVILSTTWTDDGKKGEWAGCRFDIVCEDDFDVRDGWEDVSNRTTHLLGCGSDYVRGEGRRAWVE